LHGWTIRLEDGRAEAPDVGCTRAFPTRIEGGDVLLQLPG
jgi:nitrite reductase (NADH) small subunit